MKIDITRFDLILSSKDFEANLSTFSYKRLSTLMISIEIDGKKNATNSDFLFASAVSIKSLLNTIKWDETNDLYKKNINYKCVSSKFFLPLLINYILIIHTDEILPLFNYFFFRFSKEKQMFIIEQYRKILDDVAFQYNLNDQYLLHKKKIINDCLNLFENKISNSSNKGDEALKEDTENRNEEVIVFDIDEEKLQSSFNKLLIESVINEEQRASFLAFFQNDLNYQVRFDENSIQVKYLIKRMIFYNKPLNDTTKNLASLIDKKIYYKQKNGEYIPIIHTQFLKVFYDSSKKPSINKKHLLIYDFPDVLKK
jgi:hypothetical protein